MKQYRFTRDVLVGCCVLELVAMSVVLGRKSKLVRLICWRSCYSQAEKKCLCCGCCYWCSAAALITAYDTGILTVATPALKRATLYSVVALKQRLTHLKLVCFHFANTIMILSRSQRWLNYSHNVAHIHVGYYLFVFFLLKFQSSSFHSKETAYSFVLSQWLDESFWCFSVCELMINQSIWPGSLPSCLIARYGLPCLTCSIFALSFS